VRVLATIEPGARFELRQAATMRNGGDERPPQSASVRSRSASGGAHLNTHGARGARNAPS
jgi:hypothetical protein